MLETLRDLAIILVAILDIVLLSILCVIAYLGYKLFVMIKDAAPKLIDTAQSTANSVKGTTDFVGEAAVTPLIRITALVAAGAKFISILLSAKKTSS